VTILVFRVDSDGEFVTSARAQINETLDFLCENVKLLFAVVPHNEKLKMKGVID